MNARDNNAPVPMAAQDGYEHLIPTDKQEGVKHVYTAMRDVKRHLAKYGIPKLRRNKDQNFDFRGIDDLYNEVCIMMVDAALLCFPRHVSHKQVERKTSTGKTMVATVVEAEFDFVSALDGSMHTARTFGEAFDSADKSTNKAMSAAHKYCYIQAFSIPLVGVDDADGANPSLNDGKPAAPLPKQQDDKKAAEKKGPEAAKKPTLIPEPTGVDPAVTVEAMRKALIAPKDEAHLRGLFSKYQDSVKLWKTYSPKQRKNWLEILTTAKEEGKKALTPGATTTMPPTEEKQ